MQWNNDIMSKYFILP